MWFFNCRGDNVDVVIHTHQYFFCRYFFITAKLKKFYQVEGLTYLLHKMSWCTSSRSLWPRRGVTLPDSVFTLGRDCLWLRVGAQQIFLAVQRWELFAPQNSETVYQQIHQILIRFCCFWRKQFGKMQNFIFLFLLICVFYFFCQLFWFRILQRKRWVFPKYYYAIVPSTPWTLNLWFLVRYPLPHVLQYLCIFFPGGFFS